MLGDNPGTAGPAWTSEGLAGIPEERTAEASRCCGNQACFVFTAAVFTLRWTEVILTFMTERSMRCRGGDCSAGCWNLNKMIGIESFQCGQPGPTLSFLTTEDCIASLQFTASANKISVATAAAHYSFVIIEMFGIFLHSKRKMLAPKPLHLRRKRFCFYWQGFATKKSLCKPPY